MIDRQPDQLPLTRRLTDLADYAADAPPSLMNTDMVALMREAAAALASALAREQEMVEALKACVRAYEIVVSNGGGSFNRHFPDAAGKAYAALRNAGVAHD